MAVANVALREDLRPWHNAGLNYLFIDETVEAWLEEGKKAQQAASPAGASQNVAAQTPHVLRQSQSDSYAAPAPAQRAGQHGYTPQAATEHSSPQRPYSGTAANGSAGPAGQQHRPAAPQPPRDNTALQPQTRPKYTPQESPDACTMREDKPEPPQASTLPPEQWPATWQAAWAKIPGPAPVVWTYWSLGDDLCGNANAERGALLRRIIGSLQLPRGTSAFWPVAMPPQNAQTDTDESGLVADPALFLAGIERIKPRRVFAFGSRALRSFAPHCGLRPYQFVHFNGFRLYAMPDIDYLLESPGPVDAVISCLRVALQQMR
ncbi:hypothetical protein [Oleidesulfovibrio sp.]|uniref:hypothetical protein n=1 Tax=Oleidesulfovibrio sp. TaxID=2909707 RepID=UPI003A845E1F